MDQQVTSASREDRFRAVYEETYADLLGFVQRRVHPTHAEDVVADVFLVAWRRLDDLPETLGDQRAWLFGVARHSLLNDRRGSRRRDALTVRLAQAEPRPTGGAPDSDLVAARLDLAVCWPRLSPVEQEAIALSVLDGLNATQAAALLGITAVAFRLRLSRARRSLRRHLDTTEPTPARADPVPERNQP